MSRPPWRCSAAATDAVVSALLLVFAAACGGPTAAEVVGIYRLRWTDLPVASPLRSDNAEPSLELAIELRADGMFFECLGAGDQTRERRGRWSLSDHRVSLEPQQGETQVADWQAGELHLRPSGHHMAMTLRRQSD